MFFTIEEIVKWLGLTAFEIWTNLIALLIFTIKLAIEYNPNIDVYNNNWWMIFLPLFAGDALNAYFCTIVFIRMQREASIKSALLRVCWSSMFLFMTFLFKFLLCKRLTGHLSLDFSEIFTPVFILLQLIAVRACQQS